MYSEDIHSPESMEKRFRYQYNDRIVQEAWEFNNNSTDLNNSNNNSSNNNSNNNINCKLDSQIAILDNEVGEASNVQFHPFENTVVVADSQNSLSVSFLFIIITI